MSEKFTYKITEGYIEIFAETELEALEEMDRVLENLLCSRTSRIVINDVDRENMEK